MKRNIILMTCAVAALCLVPDSVFSADSFDNVKGNDLFAGKLDNEVGTMVKTLFGYPTKIAGVLAGSYGMLQSYVSASPKPVMMWGGYFFANLFYAESIKNPFYHLRGYLCSCPNIKLFKPWIILRGFFFGRQGSVLY